LIQELLTQIEHPPGIILIIIVLCSFFLIKKNQKIKTESSFRAKAMATNLLRDPSRQGTMRESD